MSKYGDSRLHMEDWQDQLVERAEQVGSRQATQEYLQVLQDFFETYDPEKP